MMMAVSCLSMSGFFPLSVQRLVAKPRDLVGDDDALVGDDALHHPHPLLEPLGMGGILGGLLGGQPRLELHPFLAMVEPAPKQGLAENQQDRQADDYESDQDF